MPNIQPIVDLVCNLPSDEWKQFLQSAIGLDATSPTLQADLTALCTVDRSVPGFQDFGRRPSPIRGIESPIGRGDRAGNPQAPLGDQAVVPGEPVFSALFHAFASPLVKPANAKWWPDAAFLDVLENLILALKPILQADIPHGAVIGVFAYEYRPAASTTHRRHADFVYSRTGVSRVGETKPVWDGSNRCWLSLDTKGKVAAMPARYGAFLATPALRSPETLSVIGDTQEEDDDLAFLLPIHKLFPGDDCIDGMTLGLAFEAFHRREKLRRIFTQHNGFTPPTGIDAPPYVRECEVACAPTASDTGSLVNLTGLSGSILISSPPDILARPAVRPDGDLATIAVPPRSFLHRGDLAVNRDATSLRVENSLTLALIEYLLSRIRPIKLSPRQSPEFVNIRYVADPDNPRDPTKIVSLSRTLSTQDYARTINDGHYNAVLFEDSTCDGCVTVSVAALHKLPVRPAFSLITAPDFFPYADEIDLSKWVKTFPNHNVRDQFAGGGPDPLCNGRLPPNITLRLPGSRELAFSSDDAGATAIVGRPYASASGPTHRTPLHRTTTFLTDGASNVFAPGWDVTFAEKHGTKFYATFGLGAPFLEDVKLCAAVNGFWPAASPDAARTFNKGPTAIPMLDQELGFHKDNARRAKSAPDETFGWDGEQGPFIVGGDDPHAEFVNYASFWRSDYIANYRDRGLKVAALSDVDSDELIRRMDCLRLCIQCLPGAGATVASTKLWLVHANKSPAPTNAVGSGDCSGYRYEFVLPVDGDPSNTEDPNRIVQRFTARFDCLIAPPGSSAALHGALTWTEVGGTRSGFVLAPA